MTALRTRGLHLVALFALTIGLAALLLGGPIGNSSRAHAGGGDTLTLSDGGQFLFWNLAPASASDVFTTVTIAWLFNAIAVNWTSFIPALGVTNFPLSNGAVRWVVSDGA